MQWSADRNGGFSRADTQRLYLPPIMDPVYGYPVDQRRGAGAQLVVAAALDAAASSACARRTACSGAARSRSCIPTTGTSPPTCASSKARVVLCVANLSRTSQAVSLDLSRFSGRTPVEMIGWSAFPPIVDDRYVHHAARPRLLLVRAGGRERCAGGAPKPATPQPPEFITVVLPRGRAESARRTGAHDARTRRAADGARRARAARARRRNPHRSRLTTSSRSAPTTSRRRSRSLGVAGRTTKR